MKDQAPAGHYVYLYRDKSGKPRYVGYGKDHARAAFHATGTHNESLSAFLDKNDYALEIAGPFGTKDTAMAVETAVISALQPECNISKGKPQCRFRPFGVPSKYSSRLMESPLAKKDLMSLGPKGKVAPVLFVYIGSKDFEDGRKGNDPANPVPDDELLARIEKWWQIGSLIREWETEPESSPALLIGVSGKPQARIIIGAVEINRAKWAMAKPDGSGLYKVPTKGPKNLDAEGLRGRRIAVDAKILFGAFPSQFFLILGSNGTTQGGSPSLRSK